MLCLELNGQELPVAEVEAGSSEKWVKLGG